MTSQRKGGGFGPRDYTGSNEAGGYPRTGAGSGGADLPHGWGGTRYGGESEGARQAAFFMQDPAQQRARSRMPRSYRRSDERVREDICERLSADPRVDPGDVSVEVREGRVVLAGTVPERRMKYLIEDIAAECLRANEVDNRIAVARSGDGTAGEQSTGAGPRVVNEPPGP